MNKVFKKYFYHLKKYATNRYLAKQTKFRCSFILKCISAIKSKPIPFIYSKYLKIQGKIDIQSINTQRLCYTKNLPS